MSKLICPDCGESVRNLYSHADVCRRAWPAEPNTSLQPRKRGRPRIGETRDKPWEKLGMSERTWQRRRAEAKKKGER